MTDEIQRHKAFADLTPAEHVARLQGGGLPETDEYRAAKAKALADAGLEPDNDEQLPADCSQWTPEQHFAHIQKESR